MQEQILWNSKTIPLIANLDIIVVGAGPGGLGAAVLASKQGKKVGLFEQSGRAGGAAAVCEVSPFMLSGNQEEFFDKIIFTTWLEKIISYLPKELKEKQTNCKCKDSSGRLITPAIAALAAEDMLLEANVKLFYHFRLVDVIMDDDNKEIKYIILHSKSGFAAAAAKVFIDSTGDGDLAALSNCPFEYGDEMGGCQPMTTCFDMGDATILGNDVRCQEFQEVSQSAFAQAVKDKVLSSPRENLLCFNAHDKNAVHFNTTRIIGLDGTDGLMLSEAEIEGRRQIREYITFLRNYLPGFENSSLKTFGDVGVRESRRIKGKSYLTREDVTVAKHFKDGIAKCNYGIDIHNPRGKGTEIVNIKQEDYYEIPFGSLVPLNAENLLIGSRCISADVAAHSSLRVMPTVCSIGQACGVAAAIAIDKQLKVSQIDGVEVRKQLNLLGAQLD